MAQTPGRTASSLRVEKDSRVFKLSVVSSCRSRRTSSSGDSRSLLFSERPSAFLTLSTAWRYLSAGSSPLLFLPPELLCIVPNFKEMRARREESFCFKSYHCIQPRRIPELEHGSQSDSLLFIVVVLISAANSQRDGAGRFPSSSSLNFERKSFRNEGAHSS